MDRNKRKAVLGMSGGVDSAAAAYLLKEKGFEVVGVMLKVWDCSLCGKNPDLSNSKDEEDARRVAEKLGIDFYVADCRDDFKNTIVDNFRNEYINGRTPNPCVLCNRIIKFENLLKQADILGAEYIATGHYASVVRLENGRLTVKKSSFAGKDQTYMLYRLSQEQLSRTLFPLCGMEKDEIRQIAESAGIHVAHKKDSQEICFVPDGDYASFLRDYSDTLDLSGESLFDIDKEGDFVDSEGKILGKHKGIVHYTIGQRKGLGLPMGVPVYVTGIDSALNRVIIGSEKELFSSKACVKDYNFLSICDLAENENIRARVKIRYRHTGEYAYIERYDQDTLLISFDNPVKSVTPGQSAVFYDDEDRIIGGGIICNNEL